MQPIGDINFEGANMEESEHTYNAYSNINYTDSNLSGSIFFLCELTNCLFSKANLSNVFFGGCVFTDKTVNLQHANVAGTLFICCTYNKEPVTRTLLKQYGAANSDGAITNLDELLSALLVRSIPKKYLLEYLASLEQLYVELKKENSKLQAVRALNSINILNFSNLFVQKQATDENIESIEKVINYIQRYLSSIAPFNTIPALQLLSAQYIINNKALFFEALVMSDSLGDIPTRYPELDTDYQRVFINKINDYLKVLTFNEDTDEYKVITQLRAATLKKETAYNEVNKIVRMMAEKMKIAFFSLYAQRLTPIKVELIKLLNDYVKLRDQVNAIKQHSNNNK